MVIDVKKLVTCKHLYKDWGLLFLLLVEGVKRFFLGRDQKTAAGWHKPIAAELTQQYCGQKYRKVSCQDRSHS